jgi:ATP-dependent 26S proteasome regulatory subunit
MANHEHYHSSPAEKIHGDYADIDLVSSAQWSQFFEGHTQYERIYNGDSDTLPHPFHEATLDYWKDRRGGNLHMTALTSFSPDSIDEPERATSWQTDIIDRLREYMQSTETEIFQSPHEISAFYVRVAPEYVARVQSMTSLRECTMTLQLEMINEVEDALGIQIPDRDEPTDPYLLFKNFVAVWSDVIDIVAHTYGDTQDPAQIRHAHIVLRPNHLKMLTTGFNDNQPLAMPQREIIDEQKVGFDTIVGYEDIKQKLRSLAIIQKHPELAADLDLDSTFGALLHGVPGTGKTTMLKAFANEIGAELVELSVSDIIEKWVGDSARNLDAFFDTLTKRTEKIVVLMDEFDALGASDQHAPSAERTDVVNRLKEHIVTIGERHHNILLVGATNNLHRIDKALLRPGRFQAIEVLPPNETTRRQILQQMVGKTALKAILLEVGKPNATSLHVANDINYDELATISAGMVGAHFKEVLNTIRRQRLLEFDETGTMLPIRHADILREIQAIDLEP